jgi:hypothetical protein
LPLGQRAVIATRDVQPSVALLLTLFYAVLTVSSEQQLSVLPLTIYTEITVSKFTQELVASSMLNLPSTAVFSRANGNVKQTYAVSCCHKPASPLVSNHGNASLFPFMLFRLQDLGDDMALIALLDYQNLLCK